MFSFLAPLASPPGFYRFADIMLPWLVGGWILTFVSGLIWGLAIAPADYQQGEAYRIIFVHVPAAWMSLFVYTAMTVAAIIGLVWRFKLSPVFTAAAAPLGAVFTFLALLTGSVWGKPMWGAWWVWDARLTSELILLFLYLGFIALRNAVTDIKAAETASAVLLIVGFANIPIIHYSVEWWNTLHQPAGILRFDKPALHWTMLAPLLWMALSYLLFFAAAMLLTMQTELLRRGLRLGNNLRLGDK